MFIKVIPGPDQFIRKPEPRYDYEEYRKQNLGEPVELNGELVYPPTEYGPENLSASDKAAYSGVKETTMSSPA